MVQKHQSLAWPEVVANFVLVLVDHNASGCQTQEVLHVAFPLQNNILSEAVTS